MTITAAARASTAILTGAQVKSLIAKLWTPATTSGSTSVSQLAASQTSAGAGDALIKGAHDAAKQGFLFSLKIAFDDKDRAASARQYLAATSDLSDAEKSDQVTQSLQLLAHSIISRDKNNNNIPGTFLSTYR